MKSANTNGTAELTTQFLALDAKGDLIIPTRRENEYLFHFRVHSVVGAVNWLVKVLNEITDLGFFVVIGLCGYILYFVAIGGALIFSLDYFDFPPRTNALIVFSFIFFPIMLGCYYFFRKAVKRGEEKEASEPEAKQLTLYDIEKRLRKGLK